MTNTTLVLRAEGAQFQRESVRELPVTVGQSLRITCRTTQLGVPTPTVEQFSWRRADNDNQWPLDERVQIDDNGM